jgi:hypothetical protein
MISICRCICRAHHAATALLNLLDRANESTGTKLARSAETVSFPMEHAGLCCGIIPRSKKTSQRTAKTARILDELKLAFWLHPAREIIHVPITAAPEISSQNKRDLKQSNAHGVTAHPRTAPETRAKRSKSESGLKVQVGTGLVQVSSSTVIFFQNMHELLYESR